MNTCTKKRLWKTAVFLWLGLLIFFLVDCKNIDNQEIKKLSTLPILQKGSDRFLHGYGNMYGHLLFFLPFVQQKPEGDFEGALAERWEHSVDYKEWTYYLRKNVRWHDGVPVTADDIAFSIDFYKHPEVLEWSTKSSYTVIDDHTIRIHYPAASFSPDPWYSYFPKHILENLDIKEYMKWDFWYQPVGNGPFRYVRHVPQTMVELEANPDYFAGKPKIDKVIIKFAENSIVELLSGHVQIADVDQADLPKLKSDGRFNFFYKEAGPGTAIYWNHNHPFFSDSRVRKALTLALDRRDLLEALTIQGHYPVDVIYTENQWRRDEVDEGLPYDPEAAKKLLSEAGFKDSDKDGILDRDGEPFRFTALLVRGNWSLQFASVFVQGALHQIGVQMDISYLPAGVMKPRILEGDFDAYFNRSSQKAPAYLEIFGPKPSKQTPWIGWIGIHHKPIYDLMNEAAQATTPEQMDAAYRKIWEAFEEEIPLTYLYPVVFNIAADKRVKGLSSPYGAQFPIYLEHIWIEEEK